MDDTNKERENVHFDLSPNAQPIIQDSPKPQAGEAVKQQGTIKSREISNADREGRIARY